MERQTFMHRMKMKQSSGIVNNQSQANGCLITVTTELNTRLFSHKINATPPFKFIFFFLYRFISYFRKELLKRQMRFIIISKILSISNSYNNLYTKIFIIRYVLYLSYQFPEFNYFICTYYLCWKLSKLNDLRGGIFENVLLQRRIN